MVREFNYSPENMGSFPVGIILKPQNLLLDDSLLNIRQYKVQINDYWSNQRVRISTVRNTFVLELLKWERSGHPWFRLTNLYIYIYIRGAYDKFPDLCGMGIFIDNTHTKLYSPSK